MVILSAKPGARLRGIRYRRGAGDVIPAILEDGAPAAIGWLGGVGLGVLCFLFAVNAAAAPSLFQPTLPRSTPSWLHGPLGGLIAAPSAHATVAMLDTGLPVMFLFYCLALLGSGRMPARHVFGLVALTQVITTLGPAPYGTDQFIYLEFARLWSTFGLNPYANPIVAAPHIGVLYQWSVWPGALSPYGPFFTLLLAPFSTLPAAAAYWSTRLLILAIMLITTWLCGTCAAEIGASRQRAIAFVGLNPLILFYCVGGSHNDVVAVLPVLLAMLFLIRSRHASPTARNWSMTPDQLAFAAGFLLAVGTGVKASVLVCAPALLVAAERRRSAIAGFAVGGAVVWLVTVLCFGGYLPALATESNLVGSAAIGSVIAHALGMQGETIGVHAVFEFLTAAAVVATFVMAWRRPGESVTYATWAALALVATLSWPEPWYAALFLFPACCSRSLRLKAACIGATLLLVLVFLPDASWLTGGSNPLSMLHWNALVASQS